ncbi:MAG TPA: SRPBCC family protein [Acidimicrobiia bacterium]|nr:SRPBCC family protein [Acidimicrobiia bacterium]
MPSQSFQSAARAAVPVDEAWAALQHPTVWEGVAGVDHVTDAEHDREGNMVAFAFAAVVGGMRYPGTSQVTHRRPPAHMRLELDTSELVATIDVALAPAEAQTDLRFELTVRTKSLLAGMFFPAIADSIGRGFPQAADDLATRLSG